MKNKGPSCVFMQFLSSNKDQWIEHRIPPDLRSYARSEARLLVKAVVFCVRWETTREVRELQFFQSKKVLEKNVEAKAKQV